MLIALCDPSQSMHGAVPAWLARVTDAVATCPIAENGAVRILSQPKYATGSPISTSNAVFAVREMRNVAGYEFWPDDVSLLDTEVFDANALMGPAQVTDSYLLALAVKRDAVLVTLDTRLMLSAVTGPQPGICIRCEPASSRSDFAVLRKRQTGGDCRWIIS